VLKLYFGSFARQKRKPASIILNSIAEDCINVWIELYQPTLPKRAVVKKIRALVKKYTQLRKNQDSSTASIKNAIKTFAESLNVTFDIVYVQGKDGTANKALSKQGVKRTRYTEEENEMQTSEDECDDHNDNSFNAGLSRFHKKALNEVPTSKFRTAIISPNVTSILDRNSMSGRESIMFLGAVAVEMDEDIDASLVSRTTLERHRKKNRSEITSSIKAEVAQWGDVPLVVHWDEKMLVIGKT
jgi:hypothetical protein